MSSFLHEMPKGVGMDWPKKIDAIRSELGCSKAELTRRLGFEGQYIIDIEKGRSKNPSTKFVESLVALGVNPLWLFLDKGDVFSSGSMHDEKMESLKNENHALKAKLNESGMELDDAISILNEMHQLKKKHREMVIKYIKSLAEKEVKNDKMK
jgi:transcriptional regulator with XRE-family HTH domain